MRARRLSHLRLQARRVRAGGALAGLAGFLIAVRDGFVNPEMLAWQESGTVLLMLILGGLGTCAARSSARSSSRC
jgi:branched-chain amino acid transport system permease protein